jgi:hypothetical protein
MSTIVHPSSEFVQLAGREVKLQYIEHEGERIEDAAQRIKKLAECDEAEERACVRMWLRWEFNLPATVRAHCCACFIRVFPHEEFLSFLETDKVFNYQEYSYKLHWQSNLSVCMMAPLIAVSFRRTHEGECFAVAQVWAPKTNKTYQSPTTNPAKE